MDTKRYIVTLNDAGAKTFSTTAKKVALCGMKVIEKMPSLGMIVGEVNSKTADKTAKAVNSMESVSSVEEEGTSHAIGDE